MSSHAESIQQVVQLAGKPKVLIIGPSPPPYNGMSVATELLLNALGDEFCVMHLDTADRRGLSNVGRIDFRNVLLAAYHGFKYLLLLLLKNPKIVYVQIAQDQLAFLRDSLFLIPARLLGKKVIVHLHGGHFATFYRSASASTRRLIRYCLGRTARAIVLGRSLEGMFEGILPAERIRIIPNGIPDYFGDERCCVGDRHRSTVLFLSTLMREKGTLDVIAALPSIAERIPDVQAIFAGEWYRPEDRCVAQETINSLGLAAHVKFVGTVSPPFKHDLLSRADVFVLPSYNEGQPYAVLEAMAAGLPVISSGVGCIPETVIDGENGFILKPGNKEALVAKLALLLGDHDLRKKMGEASRRRFLENYRFDRFAGDIGQVFKEALFQG
jgi:glycosyltransferase involved in cell wall biosynthesis